MKIYIHHFYSEHIFYKICHNTTNRIFEIQNEKGTIFCKYNNIDLEVIFDPNLNDNTDGIHILDYWAVIQQKKRDAKYSKLNFKGEGDDVLILNKFNELLTDRKNWIITFFRTEKVFMKHDLPWDFYIGKVEAEINKIRKNNIIITDNIFLKEGVESLYKNCYFAFTNTIFEWNSIISIRYYYEFKETFDRLNFNYDLCYSVRQHKPHRVKILKLLNNIDNQKIYLQRTDSLFYSGGINNQNGVIQNVENLKELDLKNIYFNKLIGNTDFANLTWIEYEHGINWDVFFRFLSKAKMQILDESWAWFNGEFFSQYLSEKTIGLILAGIPFISTHSYPLEILEKLLNIEPHPFMEDFKNHKGDSKIFVEFVKKFMENYDENYIKCKRWSDKCHELLMIKIENENSLLEMFIDNFKKEKNNMTSYKKLI